MTEVVVVDLGLVRLSRVLEEEESPVFKGTIADGLGGLVVVEVAGTMAVLAWLRCCRKAVANAVVLAMLVGEDVFLVMGVMRPDDVSV